MVKINFQLNNKQKSKNRSSVMPTETLTDVNKEVGLEVNIEKTKYMLVSCDQNADHNHDIKIVKRSF
jgi:hypothetical protein